MTTSMKWGINSVFKVRIKKRGRFLKKRKLIRYCGFDTFQRDLSLYHHINYFQFSILNNLF